MSWPRISDFKLVTEAEVDKKRRCSECGKGNLMISYQAVKKWGVKKVVCSLACAETFDARF